VCADLENEGYQVQSFVIPACAVEARHRRDRCWIVGYSESNGRACTSKPRSFEASVPNQSERKKDSLDLEGASSLPTTASYVADTTGERVQGLRPSGEQESYAHAQSLVPLCEGQEPTPTNWQVEPDVDRVVDGLPNRVDRIKSLGNAVVPQLVQRIGEIIYANHIGASTCLK